MGSGLRMESGPQSRGEQSSAIGDANVIYIYIHIHIYIYIHIYLRQTKRQRNLQL